jgi:hypothetical protein
MIRGRRGGVGALDRLVEVGHAPDRERGAEHLFGGHGAVVRRVGNYGRRVEEAIGEIRIVVWRAAAGEKLTPGFDASIHLRGHLGALRIGVHRAHLGALRIAAPHLEPLGLGGYRFDHLIGHRLEHVHALDCQAGLAAVVEPAHACGARRGR